MNRRRSIAALACALTAPLAGVAVAHAQELEAAPAPEAAAPLDVTAPQLTLRARRVQRLAPHLAASAACDEPCEFEPSARVHGVPGLSFLRVVTPMKAGDGGREMRFEIRVSRRAHKLISGALREERRVQVAVTVSAYDLADNETVGTRWIRVRPPGDAPPLRRS